MIDNSTKNGPTTSTATITGAANLLQAGLPFYGISARFDFSSLPYSSLSSSSSAGAIGTFQNTIELTEDPTGVSGWYLAAAKAPIALTQGLSDSQIVGVKQTNTPPYAWRQKTVIVGNTAGIPLTVTMVEDSVN